MPRTKYIPVDEEESVLLTIDEQLAKLKEHSALLQKLLHPILSDRKKHKVTNFSRDSIWLVFSEVQRDIIRLEDQINDQSPPPRSQLPRSAKSVRKAE